MDNDNDNASDFGDADPEDSWDPDDAVEDLLANIVRRVAVFLAANQLLEAEAQRLRMIRDDLEHITARVRARRIESEH